MDKSSSMGGAGQDEALDDGGEGGRQRGPSERDRGESGKGTLLGFGNVRSVCQMVRGTGLLDFSKMGRYAGYKRVSRR